MRRNRDRRCRFLFLRVETGNSRGASTIPSSMNSRRSIYSFQSTQRGARWRAESAAAHRQFRGAGAQMALASKFALSNVPAGCFACFDRFDAFDLPKMWKKGVDWPVFRWFPGGSPPKDGRSKSANRIGRGGVSFSAPLIPLILPLCSLPSQTGNDIRFERKEDGRGRWLALRLETTLQNLHQSQNTRKPVLTDWFVSWQLWQPWQVHIHCVMMTGQGAKGSWSLAGSQAGFSSVSLRQLREFSREIWNLFACWPSRRPDFAPTGFHVWG